MLRVTTLILSAASFALVTLAAQGSWRVWKAAESRKNLLAHFVDHNKTMSEREINEARFWSDYGELSYGTFKSYLFGGFCGIGVAGWLGGRARKARNERPVNP